MNWSLNWPLTSLTPLALRAAVLAAAYLLDRLFGDPNIAIPHPVVLIGRGAARLERWLRPRLGTIRRELVGGGVLVVAVVGLTFIAAWLLIFGLGRIHPSLGIVMETWLVATALAARGLADAGLAVAERLEAEDLPAARRAVGGLVGRSTAALDGEGVSRAAIESVAENYADGFVVPLLYAAVGGAPLALAYKAINTLDSMYGYKDEARLYFGRAAARVDDVANWIPARLSGVLLCLTASFVGADAPSAWRTMWKQRRDHPSPNAGYPEAAMAGALGVRLGGENVYPGGRSFRPHLGRRRHPLSPERIRAAVHVMQRAALVATALAVGALLIAHYAGR